MEHCDTVKKRVPFFPLGKPAVAGCSTQLVTGYLNISSDACYCRREASVSVRFALCLGRRYSFAEPGLSQLSLHLSQWPLRRPDAASTVLETRPSLGLTNINCCGCIYWA